MAIATAHLSTQADSEDHNVSMYFPCSDGGGVQQLFRKKDDRSSEFSADHSVVRRDGTYIYEEFVPTGGTDVKVCVAARSKIRY